MLPFGFLVDVLLLGLAARGALFRLLGIHFFLLVIRNGFKRKSVLPASHLHTCAARRTVKSPARRRRHGNLFLHLTGGLRSSG
jgi:hypothetical protein